MKDGVYKTEPFDVVRPEPVEGTNATQDRLVEAKGNRLPLILRQAQDERIGRGSKLGWVPSRVDQNRSGFDLIPLT